jgi:hypothetical protein
MALEKKQKMDGTRTGGTMMEGWGTGRWESGAGSRMVYTEARRVLAVRRAGRRATRARANHFPVVEVAWPNTANGRKDEAEPIMPCRVGVSSARRCDCWMQRQLCCIVRLTEQSNRRCMARQEEATRVPWSGHGDGQYSHQLPASHPGLSAGGQCHCWARASSAPASDEPVGWRPLRSTTGQVMACTKHARHRMWVASAASCSVEGLWPSERRMGKAKTGLVALGPGR